MCQVPYIRLSEKQRNFLFGVSLFKWPYLYVQHEGRAVYFYEVMLIVDFPLRQSYCRGLFVPYELPHPVCIIIRARTHAVAIGYFTAKVIKI